MAQLVSTINFKDTGNNSVIRDSGSDLLITAPSNLVFNPSGSINLLSDLNCQSQAAISGATLVHSENNTDIIVSSTGTRSVLLRTNNTNRITLSQTTGITFATAPECSAIPTLPTEFMNWNSLTNIQSFTPALTVSAGTLTVVYGSRGGRYLQFGQMVWFTCFINCTTCSGTVPGATLRISLPVTIPNNTANQSLTVGKFGNLVTTAPNVNIYAMIPETVTSRLLLYYRVNATDGSTIPLTVGNVGNLFSIVVTGSYYLFL